MIFGVLDIGKLDLGPPVYKIAFWNIETDIFEYEFSANSLCENSVSVRLSHSRTNQEKYWTFASGKVLLGVTPFLHLHDLQAKGGDGMVLEFYSANKCGLTDVKLSVNYISSLSRILRRYAPALLLYPAGIELLQTPDSFRRGMNFRQFALLIPGLFCTVVLQRLLLFTGLDASLTVLGHYHHSYLLDFATVLFLTFLGLLLLDLYRIFAGALLFSGRLFSIFPSLGYFGRIVLYSAFLIATFFGLPNHLVILLTFFELWIANSLRSKKSVFGAIRRKLFLLNLILLAVSIPQLFVWIQGINKLGLLHWRTDKNPIFTVPFLLFLWRARYEGLDRTEYHWAPLLAFQACGWVLLFTGISLPFVFEWVMWTLVTVVTLSSLIS